MKSFYTRDEFNVETQNVSILLRNGGIGDYICTMPAIHYIAEHYKNWRGNILGSEFLRPLFDLFLEDLPNWCMGGEKELKILQSDSKLFATGLNKMQMPNATSMHLIDIAVYQLINTGFQYEVDKFRKYVQIGDKLNRSYKSDIKRPYAVLTPLARNQLRAMPAEVFNYIMNYLKFLDILPVLIGSNKVDTQTMLLSESYNFEGALNLIDQTNLLEAAQIINNAKFVLGIDNGLLHIAGCTETPIIFGYTIVRPEHRRPIRDKGRIIDLVPKVACRYCHSHVRGFNYNYNECFYGDIQCVKDLTFEVWKNAIDEILEENSK